jgi:cysteine synthase B
MTIRDGFVSTIGNTPLIKLRAVSQATGCDIYGKAEFLNPGGSVKDRAALAIVLDAEKRGVLRPGGVIVEGTAGNTGIGLSLVGNARGYRTVIVIPNTQSQEKKDAIRGAGATLYEVPAVPYKNPNNYVHVAQRIAEQLAKTEASGAIWAQQFDNVANREAHVRGTGPEIWRDTQGRITHFVATMGTTGTLMGCSRFLKEKNPEIRIVGAQPEEGSRIPGIRKWPQEYLPRIYDPSTVDETVLVSQEDAEEMCRRLAREEGIFGGISAGGACWVALEIAKQVEHATIAFVVCDRGDRYLSTGVFPA